jgi:hypothetical protein
MKQVVFALLASLVSVFGADQARLADEDDVREAVFRCQFTNDASGVALKGKVFFLQMSAERKADPSDAFLKRFAGHQPPVRKVSACETRLQGVVDRKTGEAGLVLHVGAIKWISDTAVEVEGGFYETGRCAASYTFTVKKEQGKWKVTKARLDEIS